MCNKLDNVECIEVDRQEVFQAHNLAIRAREG